MLAAPIHINANGGENYLAIIQYYLAYLKDLPLLTPNFGQI